MQDLSTGEVFEEIPILRAEFCDGSTVSLLPAELWRGRSTLGSVLETVGRVVRDGVEAAYEWTLFAGTGEPVVSRRTLRRWRGLVRTRLIGSTWSWLGPRLGWAWSDQQDESIQLERLLDHLSESTLTAFRATSARAVLDKATPAATAPPCPARRVAGRLTPSPPQEVSSPLRPRGSWLPRHRRRGPPPDEHGGSTDD